MAANLIRILTVNIACPIETVIIITFLYFRPTRLGLDKIIFLNSNEIKWVQVQVKKSKCRILRSIFPISVARSLWSSFKI